MLKFKEQAKIDAAKEIAEINEVLPGLYLELNEVKNELDKSKKAVISNASKTQRLLIQIKSLQAMIKQTANNPDVRFIIDESLIKNTDELLSSTVELRLHYMDVRQLKSLINKKKYILQKHLNNNGGYFIIKKGNRKSGQPQIGLKNNRCRWRLGGYFFVLNFRIAIINIANRIMRDNAWYVSITTTPFRERITAFAFLIADCNDITK